MYTEEEAKTKWCPMAKVAITDCNGNMLMGGGINRPERSTLMADSAYCIASDCMMWKWELIEKEKAKIAQEEAHGCMDVRELINSKTNGYCGLTK